MTGRWGGRAVQLGFLIALLLAWQVATTVFHVAPILLPKPAAVAVRIAALIGSLEFVDPLLITLSEVATAFALAALAGLLTGFLVTRSTRGIAVLEPLLTSINSIPAILFFPLFTLFFGLGPGSKIALGVTISFFPIALGTITGFAGVEQVLLTSARSMGASRWHLFRYVLLPSAFPIVLAGLRMGLVLAFLAVLGGETIASFDGLGHQIADAADSMEAASMYAFIVIVVMVAAGLNMLAARLDRFGRRP